MHICLTETAAGPISRSQLQSALEQSLRGMELRRVLIIPPDFTRLHSYAGPIVNLYYHLLTQRGCQVDVLPALGTHAPMTARGCSAMYGDIPFDRFLVHHWRSDVTCLGHVPGDFLEQVSGGLWQQPISVEINRRLLDPSYDLILSVGQVVPHEVVGMANYTKNLFVGVGGSEMISKSHMLGALYGLERIMGRDHTPVRDLLDYAADRFLRSLPITYVLTVCTAPAGTSLLHGLFIGDTRQTFEDAVALAQEKCINFVDRPIQKCVAFLDPSEFHTTWLGNKAVYRTRMAIADGGELLVLAPGISHFGEDPANDALIRRYGYCGRDAILAQLEQPDLRDNMSAAAHLIHGSSDGRFQIRYAVKTLSRAEIEGVRYLWADYDQAAARYDPAKLKAGFQRLPDGEEIFFIPNPALGLWICRSKFAA